MLGKQKIRVVNYHGTPLGEIKNFERQLIFFKKYYRNITKTQLNEFFLKKNGTFSKPGLIISFDDGKRNNYDHAKPLIEKYGFTGWFMLPSDIIDSPSEVQSREILNDNKSKVEYSDGRYFMNWNEVGNLVEDHVVCSHTSTHHRFNDVDSIDKINYELFESKRKIQEILGKNVDAFCWVGGEEVHYTASAHEKIILAGYNYAFMTNHQMISNNTNLFLLNRSNVETSFPFYLFVFQLCGIMDLLYYFKRRRVIKRLNN
jgi:peptidoglycan/xylan/chitin deacetylase (PgdA/CDA1 family)